MAHDLLRLATIGSVDDGKSTLIGRLLVDSRQLFEDHLDAVAVASKKRGVGDLDLSFVTDGLRAEREQGITIDVAYRYAATPTRKYVIADCPGHVQYTRNMATGASSADLALVVVDVAAGLKEQTRRHLIIAALLGVRAAIVVVNKMDTVNWSEAAFTHVVDEFATLARELGLTQWRAIPVSALDGDNVVERSARAQFYNDVSVLEALESFEPHVAEGPLRGRFPIQWVLRQTGGGRTYAGQVHGAALRVGDDITLWPQGQRTTVRAINYAGETRSDAGVGLAADLDLADDTDAGRGDLLSTGPEPRIETSFVATVCWFAERALVAGARLRLKHTTRVTPARVVSIDAVLDVEALGALEGAPLVTNDIGLVRIQTADPLVLDDYVDSRVTGSFILIDEATNITVAAGMVGRPSFLP
jgi:sulfate adenylyltransferase large subunit